MYCEAERVLAYMRADSFVERDAEESAEKLEGTWGIKDGKRAELIITTRYAY